MESTIHVYGKTYKIKLIVTHVCNFWNNVFIVTNASNWLGLCCSYIATLKGLQQLVTFLHNLISINFIANQNVSTSESNTYYFMGS